MENIKPDTLSDFKDLVGHPEIRLGEMIEATPSCLKVVDEQGRLLTMNSKGLSMIEADSLAEVAGADLFSLVAAEHRAEFIDFHRRVCAGHSGRLVFKLVGLKGTERWMETWAAPYRLTNGARSHIAITNDISERQRTAETLEQQRQALEIASRHAALGEIAAGIAHEINNPLGVIAGLAGLMKLNLSKGEIDVANHLAKLEKIEQTVARISTITGSLRTFSSDVPVEQREVCVLRDVIDATFGLVTEKSRSAGIELANDVPPQIVVEINRLHFSQVIMNLLSNSLHAVEGLPDKWINVTASQAENSVRVSFSDAGRGIPEDLIAKIMTPFFSTKAVGDGSGLGLPLAQGIMRSLGGRLSYVREAENTTFLLELPACAEPSTS